MKISLLHSRTLHALAIAATLLLHPAPIRAVVTEDALESLNQGQLQEAFRVLSEHYIENETLDYEQLNKAALDGLLRRLSFGAELVARNGDSPPPPPPFDFHEEIITKGVAYLRPVTFDNDELTRTKSALSSYRKSKIETLILDLRTPVILVEFERAAAFADYFTPPNELLFKIQKPGEADARLFLSHSDRLWNNRLIVLIDRDTSSVAETIASVLQRQFPNCLTIGQRTVGKAVQYQEIALSKTIALRFASAEVLLPDETRIFRNGVIPNLASTTPHQRKTRIFTQSATKGMAPFTLDQERPRMNEAALVAGTNPELEYYLQRSNGLRSKWDRQPLQDQTLQTALGSLIAIDFINPPVEKPAIKSVGKPKTPKAEEPASEKSSPSSPEDP